jgi:hypothetical protein
MIETEKNKTKSEYCDVCRRMVTHVKSGNKYPLLKHFHDGKGATLCLDCYWQVLHDQGVSDNPQHYYPGSLNAGQHGESIADVISLSRKYLKYINMEE